MRTSAPTNPSRFTVEIWVDRPGQHDVTALNRGEPNLTYHISVQSIRKPSKTVYLKTITSGSNPLVSFPHNNTSEWICSVVTSQPQPGSDNHSINVDLNNAGQSTLLALELLLLDPFRFTREVLNLDLPLTVT
jgi:hypothetical protein